MQRSKSRWENQESHLIIKRPTNFRKVLFAFNLWTFFGEENEEGDTTSDRTAAAPFV